MRRTFRSAAFSCRQLFPALLLDRENPDNAALGNVILQTDVVGGQRILDTLSVNTPARLDRDILSAIHLVCDRHAHDARVGLLLPKQFAGLGIEGTEIAIISSADEDEIARGRQHRTEQMRFCEIVRPDLLSGGRIPRLQLTIVIGARAYLQADILRLGAKPQLARIQRHLLAAKASAEIVVSWDVDQSGFLAAKASAEIVVSWDVDQSGCWQTG